MEGQECREKGGRKYREKKLINMWDKERKIKI